MVYVNDVLRGESPLTYDFEWYGWHRLTIRKNGYARLDDRQLLRAPIWFWIPFDLAAELSPFAIRDDRTWSYALTPATVLPEPVAPPLTGPGASPEPAKEPSNAPAP